MRASRVCFLVKKRGRIVYKQLKNQNPSIIKMNHTKLFMIISVGFILCYSIRTIMSFPISFIPRKQNAAAFVLKEGFSFPLLRLV